MIARKYISFGMTRDKTLFLLGITKHDYYYRPSNGKKGRSVTTVTSKMVNNTIIEVIDSEVVEAIISIKFNSETDYGYEKMTAALQLLGYMINKKKVYRLMQDYQLLNDKPKKIGRIYVKHRRVDAAEPLSVLEMDIKFQWVEEYNRYAFILSIIDCFTRKILYWAVGYSIKQHQVIKAWEEIIINYLQPYQTKIRELTIEVRNDNDSRFYAQKVKDYLLDNGLNQVFTHPYTPQENGHIESFHAILGKSLEKGYFATLKSLSDHLERFYKVYNETRLHGSLDHLPPDLFWELWKEGKIKTIKRTNKSSLHKLKIPHYELSGKLNQREHLARQQDEKSCNVKHIVASVN